MIESIKHCVPNVLPGFPDREGWNPCTVIVFTWNKFTLKRPTGKDTKVNPKAASLVSRVCIIAIPMRLHSSSVTPRKYAFLPCGHFDLESAVTAQNDESKGSFHSSYSRLCHNKSCALGKWACTRGEIVPRLLLTRTVHGDERWPKEVTSNTYFRGVVLSGNGK